MVLLNSFKQCTRNAIVAYERGKIGETSIAIGSMITPILEASSCRLPHFSHYSTYIDISYLNKTWFLKGTHEGKHIYRFQHPSYGACKILLPNKELTDFAERDNIVFLPTADELHMDGGDATVGHQGEPSNQLEGYHFTPFNAEGTNPAIQKAHEHIRLLQEWCKQQEKTIKKLVRTVKTLKAKLSCTSRASDDTVSVSNRRKRRAVRSPTPDSTSHETEDESFSSHSTSQ
uniref:Arabidopsis retrotransposon Orf1 C-terminal domain-containing protein n=1 Tax=Noccaea caerulescens TaxID=107243 RepID=A0A1J3F3L2_NOCCA